MIEFKKLNASMNLLEQVEDLKNKNNELNEKIDNLINEKGKELIHLVKYNFKFIEMYDDN